VLVALAGNVAIAITKFAAFGLTRSTAMLTEAIHSLVDSVDQLLLLIGQRRAARPPDETHPFGYGMEIYFWSFVVALMIFVLGGAVSVWEGVHKLLEPSEINDPWINLVVLAVSALFEGASFAVSYREYRRVVQGRDVRFLRFLRLSKDPNLFATLLEDGAALIGLSIAALGVVGSGWLGLAWADGAASVGIGLLLVAVAAFMANETRSLIAGEAAVPRIVEAARAALQDPRVSEVIDLASLHLGPRSILVVVTLRFRSGLSGDEVQQAAAELSAKVRAADPRICGVYLSPGDIGPGQPAKAA
jgi:cation diffusion facilitator family transporter